jgi:hypothetical protein
VTLNGNSNCYWTGYNYKNHGEPTNTETFTCNCYAPSHTAVMQPLRNGFYKVNIYVNNVLTNYIYYDDRDADIPKGSCYPYYTCYYPMRSRIEYNASLNRIRWTLNYQGGNWSDPIATGSILNLRELLICNPQNFSPFWENGLVVIEGSNSHPRIIWGPIPNNTHYNVHRKYGSSPWSLKATVNALEYLDTEVSLVQPGGQSGTTVKYKVAPVNNSTWFTNDVSVVVVGGEIEKRNLYGDQSMVNNFKLSAFPNPFNPITKILYSVPVPSLINLKIYNIFGEEVIELVNENLEQGEYWVEFNADNLPSGFYFCQLSAEKKLLTQKLVFIK